MKTRLTWLYVVGALAVPLSAFAAPAVRLSVDINPCIGICPAVADFFALERGEVVPLRIRAVDAAGDPDPGYVGTVTFASSDPLATLPPTYVFAPADQGDHVFLASTAFQTLGLQTITATDAANGISGSASVTIVQFASPIPAIAPVGVLTSIALLAIVGIWLIRGTGA